MALDRLEDLVCPYCNEEFEVFTSEPEMLTVGERVVAFRASCAKCDAMVTIGVESLALETTGRVAHSFNS